MTRGRGALLLGAIVGASSAAVGLLLDAPTDVPSDAVAVVEGRPILREDYERALAAVAADRRSELSEADRARVLQRLIDEELLVARGLELGLETRDRRVRADLSAAAIAAITGHAEEHPPTEAELRAFHAFHAERFRSPPRFRVVHAFFASGDDPTSAERRALAARGGALAGAGDPPPLPLPPGELPLSALVRHLGPTAARAVSELEPGETTAPIGSRGGYHVLRLLERTRGELPPFEAIEDAVRAEHRRQAAERALQEFLDARRRQADIRTRRPS